MVEFRTLQTFLWNINPPIKFFYFMLLLSHSQAVELPHLQMPINVQQEGLYVLLLSTYLQTTKVCKRDFTHLSSHKSPEA